MKLISIAVLILIFGFGEFKAQTMETITLNENWQFKQAESSSWHPASVPGTVHTDLLANHLIEDPFYRTNEKNLQWIDKADWVYETHFVVEDGFLEKEMVELVFEGLDTYADVFLNDQLIIQADNFFVEWRCDVKHVLRTGRNHLKVYFHSPIRKGLELLKSHGFSLPADNDQSVNGGLKSSEKVSPFTRKPGYHYGWDWGPRLVTSGIWRPVSIHAWDTAKIENLHFFQVSASKDRAILEARFEVFSSRATKMTFKVKEGNREIAVQETTLQPGKNHFTLPFYIDQPEFWWTNGLGKPHLYQFSGEIYDQSHLLDVVSSNIGIRTIRVIQKEDGKGRSFYFELNGIPIFAKGANYIPNDVFIPRVSEADYRTIISSAKQANMNMLRVWGGGFYENEIFYNLCDEAGILVWQDFMLACSMYPGDVDFLEKVKEEAIYNIKRLRNHACLALWCGNNEMDLAWSQYNEFGGWWWKQRYGSKKRKLIWQAYDTIFHQLLPDLVNELHPNIFYWPSSPFSGPGEHASNNSTKGDIHYWGVWHWKAPFSAFESHIGRFMSEYGFQSFPEFESVKKYTIEEDRDIQSAVMTAHQRSGIGNLRIKSYMDQYFKVPTRFDHFLYVGQLLQAKGIKTAIHAHRSAMPYCMGSLYWQLNDCWPVASWSGMDYYKNWKALHYSVKKAFSPTILTVKKRKRDIEIYLVTDSLDSISGIFRAKMIQFSGESLWYYSKPVQINKSGAFLIGWWPEDWFKQKGDLKNALLELTLESNSGKVCTEIFYFSDEKELHLPKQTDIDLTVQSINEQEFRVTLTSSQLVKNIFLFTQEIEGTFSDNYFDLLPCQVYEVVFTTSELNKNVEARQIDFISLADTL